MVIPLLPRTMFWWPYLGYDWIRDWQICISKGDKGEKRFNYKMSVVSSCVLIMFFTEQITSWKYLKVQCRAYLRYILQNNLKIHMYVIYGVFFAESQVFSWNKTLFAIFWASFWKWCNLQTIKEYSDRWVDKLTLSWWCHDAELSLILREYIIHNIEKLWSNVFLLI